MTMAAGKWQQPRKQRPHRRWKQRPLGGGDTGSGGGGNIGTTMTATTGDEDYDAGRASCVSIHILRTIVLDYGELLAYWFILHGCSTLDRGSRPVSFHDSLTGFTM
jgi:hypothetical protein